MFNVPVTVMKWRFKASWVVPVMLAIVLSSGACSRQPDAEAELKSESQSVAMANPAAVFCAEQGGVNEIVKTPSGAVGLCHFPDGSVCDDWAFHRAQCAPGDSLVDDAEAVD